MLLIYTHKVTHRSKYIFNLIFKDILGIDFTMTSELAEFSGCNGAKLSYTNNAVADEVFFSSRNLLFENEIGRAHV